jgi:hypothetical protein
MSTSMVCRKQEAFFGKTTTEIQTILISGVFLVVYNGDAYLVCSLGVSFT